MPHSENSPADARCAGVLLHITSLPGAYGCGDLGPCARQFADRLGASGQRYWQLLPLNPTTAGAGYSPYFSISSQSGNALLLSIEDLVAEGLLQPSEVSPGGHHNAGAADFALAREAKLPLIRIAADRLREAGTGEAFARFVQTNAHWLEDHALFTALQDRHQAPWYEWPEALKQREPTAIAEATQTLAEEIEREKVVQFLFHQQWERLRSHCHEQGVQLFGDIPIYVHYDSADVWANTDIFVLDESLRPTLESGVPPDYFSADGQLWRNPVYNWERLKETGFAWWKGRLSTQFHRFDLLRIDHFRGLIQFWAVPAGSANAIHGEWRDVPFYELFDAVREHLGAMSIVAEDLGTITPDVIEARDHYHIPGMIVLQFAFNDDNHDNPYVPDNHSENAVAYLGTHDNNTARGWLQQELDDRGWERLARHTKSAHSLRELPAEDQVRECIELLLSSRANTAIVCAQDLLALPKTARMNTPGLEAGNWDWQLSPEQFEALPMAWLGERSHAHGRC